MAWADREDAGVDSEFNPKIFPEIFLDLKPGLAGARPV
jgi:hypothetical protein